MNELTRKFKEGDIVRHPDFCSIMTVVGYVDSAKIKDCKFVLIKRY